MCVFARAVSSEPTTQLSVLVLPRRRSVCNLLYGVLHGSHARAPQPRANTHHSQNQKTFARECFYATVRIIVGVRVCLFARDISPTNARKCRLLLCAFTSYDAASLVQQQPEQYEQQQQQNTALSMCVLIVHNNYLVYICMRVYIISYTHFRTTIR